jgi:hypothetical protein
MQSFAIAEGSVASNAHVSAANMRALDAEQVLNAA